MKKCEKCEHGCVNFWGYDECWLRVTEIDTSTTHYTSLRERDAFVKNSEGDCKDYKRKKIKILFWYF